MSLKQYSSHDPDFVVYHSKPMKEDAAREHMRQMKASDQSKDFMQSAKWSVEPHTSNPQAERLKLE